MQYNRAQDGTMTALPKPSVDTGMGLERLSAILQQGHSNYDIDLFQNLLKAIAKLANIDTNSDAFQNASLKVIADHIRSCAFLIVDGVIPSNEGRGYVLRRIIRRAARHGHKLGLQDAFFYKLVQPLVNEMGEAYPELATAQQQVEQELQKEEIRFAKTLDKGIKILEAGIADLTGDTLSGEVVFELYDTYGFPVDLTADIARERELNIDQDGFEVAMQAQRKRARAAGKFTVNYNAKLDIKGETRFTGYEMSNYEKITHNNFIENIFIAGKIVNTVQNGEQAQLILNSTSFYAESGGQIGDTGQIIARNNIFEVHDTQKQGNLFIHHGVMQTGSLNSNDKVSTKIDSQRRQAIVLNHSATHLMHTALQKILGPHVKQKGSLVTEKQLRFDLSHSDPISKDEITQVEALVNQQIRFNTPTRSDVTSMDEAIERGAMALFGEKYGNEVRVVTIGYSTELCGGVHVQRSGDIGLFKIVNEGGVAAGVRRIEAVTGEMALAWVDEQSQRLQHIALQVKSSVNEAAIKVDLIVEKNRHFEKQLMQLKAKLATQAGADLASQAQKINGIYVLATHLEGIDPKSLRDTADKLKDKLGQAAIVLSTVNKGKVRLVAGISKAETSRIKAGDLLNYVAKQVGGKGGGRPDMAQGGGNNPDALKSALASVVQWVKENT
jgi:alanyl-tRNA synthetase